MKIRPGRARLLLQSNLLPATVLTICILRLWVMALPSSFWVDEMATVFVVQQGAHHPSLALAPQVPDSSYYWLPRVSSALFGQSETAYRIPSLLAAGLTLLLMSRLARRLVHPRAGWFAVFACVALQEFNSHAADARPYALGILAATACVWLMVRWLDSGAWVDGLVFALCAALLWPIHLIYWPFYLVLGLYTALRLGRRETKVTALQAAAMFGLTALLDVPVAVRAVQLTGHAGAHVIQPLPSLHHFEWSLRWKLVVAAAALAWLVGRLTRSKPEGPPADFTAVILAGSWWLLPPICLAAYSYGTGNSVFVPRYFSLCLPGLALAITFAARPFLSAALWRPASIAVGLGALVLLGQWSSVWPAHEHSDWRDAAAMVNREARGEATPVICTSPFIEGESPNWRPNYRLPGFLYAHLSVYRVGGHILLFPFQRSAAAEQYAASLLAGTLTTQRKFVIYGGAGNVRDWRNWFAKRAELTAWNSRLFAFGDVYVVIFTAPPAA
jgi:hypothetical protein